MRKWWSKIKAAIKRAVSKVRAWMGGALLALAVIIGGVALAGSKSFIWTNPTANVDGTPFDPATEQAETRIYCGEDVAAFVPEQPGTPQTLTPYTVTQGAIATTTKEFLAGEHTCFATVFSVYGYESEPSNVITFTVTPTVAPGRITDFSVVDQ